MAFYYKMSD